MCSSFKKNTIISRYYLVISSIFTFATDSSSGSDFLEFFI